MAAFVFNPVRGCIYLPFGLELADIEWFREPVTGQGKVAVARSARELSPKISRRATLKKSSCLEIQS